MFTTYDIIQIERYLDREKEEVGTGRCIQHVKINRQIESYLDREEDEEVITGRCIQQVTIDRQRGTQIERCIQHTTIYRQRDTQIERRRRRQAQEDVYNIQQYIDSEILRQRGGGGGYRQICIQHVTKD